MGFGFNLVVAFILIPLTVILLIVWVISRKWIFGKTVGLIWLGLLGLAFLSEMIQFLTAKKQLKKDDFYGQYIIDRDYFPGKQTDWQYENFRFEIMDNDSIHFFVTQNDKILKTFKGTITTLKPYNSERLVINMEQPTYHILTTNPTIYRSAWGYYLVFNSPKFGNVFFSKGKWKPIDM